MSVRKVKCWVIKIMDISRFYFIIQHMFDFHAVLLRILYANKSLFYKMDESITCHHSGGITDDDYSSLSLNKKEISILHDVDPLKKFN